MKLQFLYGTETGTAEMLCDDLKAAVDERLDCSIADMDATKPAVLESDTFYVLVSSTTGSGDVPGSAEAFFKALTTEKPDLSHVRFAIFGLGDTTFGDTFAQGSEKIMTAMLACEASMIGERGIFDASSNDMPEDIAIPWLEQLLSTHEIA
ncbi:MAG: flavodoxin domain-containing protein [Pseudomonadota bacterium]